MIDMTELVAIERRGYCWSIGRSRIGDRECRIFPHNGLYRYPIIIKTADTFKKAIAAALEELGDKEPRRKPPE